MSLKSYVFLGLAVSVTTLFGLPFREAQAATILVDSNVQLPSFLFDTDGDGLMSGTEINANDDVDNSDACPRPLPGLPDGLPDGNNDCLCNLSEAIVAANTDLRVDGCAPDSSGDPLFGFDTIVLEEDGPYEFKVLDNIGDNTFNSLGNGPNALPKVASDIIIDGRNNTLRRISPITLAECESFKISKTFCENFCGKGPTCDEMFFRLFETDSFLFLRDAAAEGFNPGCLAPRAIINDSSVQCFSGGFMYVEGGFVDLDNVTAQGNQTNIELPKGQSGGAVFIKDSPCPEEVVDVSIHESIIAENSSLTGGGIASGDGVLLTIDESTIRGNRAVEIPEECVPNGDDVEPCNCDGDCDTNEGPATCGDCLEESAGETGQGGGIAAFNNQLTIYESAIHDNSSDVYGGGLMVFNMTSDKLDDDCRQGGVPVPGNATVVNTTIAANQASLGGGILYVSFATPETLPTFDIQSSTIAGNAANEIGGGILKLASSAPVTLRNTIVADNTALDGADGHGLLISEGHNHVGDSSGFIMTPISGDLFDQPAGLGVWTDDGTAGNGHFPLLPLSLNVDSADGTGCPSIDQIQVNRDEDLDFLMEFEECSKGAIEYTDICGDGRLEPNNGEECDDGNTDPSDGCEPDCSITTTPEGALCGNGTVEGGETCDEGEARNSIEPDATCRPDCTAQRCGDNIVDTGETCDGGATCFDCEAVVVPSEGCGISAEDLLDPTLKSSNDLVQRYTYTVVAKCLQVTGGAGGCSLIRD